MFSKDMTFSSSNLINNHYNLHSETQKLFLKIYLGNIILILFQEQ